MLMLAVTQFETYHWF